MYRVPTSRNDIYAAKLFSVSLEPLDPSFEAVADFLSIEEEVRSDTRNRIYATLPGRNGSVARDITLDIDPDG